MTLHEFYRLFISFIYPNICPCCEKVIEHDEDFCDKCRNNLVPFYDEFKIENVNVFVAYCSYEGKIRNVIRKYKITPKGNSYYAFAFGIVQALRRKQLSDDIDGVVFIPMSKEDYKDRGYNQVKYMADEVHHLLRVPVYNVLEKSRLTVSQKGLGAELRKINIKDAFRMKYKADIKGKRLLLIDDVCTTGSTLSEAAKVLKEAGAVSVIAATFAKTMHK